jgi:phosphatidyl-myo-inositol dimannoside synthase
MTYRLASAMAGFRTQVLTLDAAQASAFDEGSVLDVRRVRGAGSRRRVANALLNGAALREAVRFRPHALLSMHIVTSPAAVAIRWARRTPAVQYFHANEITGKPRLAAFAASRADAVISVSSYTSSLIAATGAAPKCLHEIPPGVDLPPPACGPPASRPTVLTIARLESRYKGHDVLVQALAQVRAAVPDVHWVVIGDGSLRVELEARVLAAGLVDSVSFLGSIDDVQRDRWLARCDLLAMPSRLPGAGQAGEGFGVVYLEAAAHAKPVVAGNVGGAVDAVADGVSGLLVDPTDPRAVAVAITTLLRDRELARRLGVRGAERAREFAWPLIAGRVEAVLLEQVASAERSTRWRRSARKHPARTVV